METEHLPVKGNNIALVILSLQIFSLRKLNCSQDSFIWEHMLTLGTVPKAKLCNIHIVLFYN